MINCICEGCGKEAEIQYFVDGVDVKFEKGCIFLKMTCECGAYGESQIKPRGGR